MVDSNFIGFDSFGQIKKMAWKLCSCAFVAMILTLNCNIYAIPLSDILKAEKAPPASSETTESPESESTENATVNGTQKDL